MANWDILKAAIAKIIKTNGNQEITGQVLQNTLNSIVTSVGENATFAGIATPATNPGTPDGPVFYMATEPGTYANFNGLTLDNSSLVVLYNLGGTWKSSKVYECLQKLGKSQQFPMSQQRTTDSLLEISYQKSGLYLDSIINDELEPLELPELSTWSGYTLTPYFDDGEKNGLLQNALFLHSTSSSWIAIPMSSKIKSGAKYIGTIIDAQAVRGVPRFSAFFASKAFTKQDGYATFVKHSFSTVGNRAVYMGYFNIGERNYEELTDLRFLIAAHASSTPDKKVEIQLRGIKCFYIDSLSDLKMTAKDIIASLSNSLEQSSKKINSIVENNKAYADNQIAGLFSKKNFFDGIQPAKRFLALNGIQTGDETYTGYLTDYIGVSPGEVLFANLVAQARVYGWGAIWGYSDNKGNNPVIIASVYDVLANSTYYIPTDGSVKFIRACSKAPNNGSIPFLSGSSVLELISEKVFANKANTAITDRFLVDAEGGGISSNNNYKGYLVNHLPVKPGEKYYIKGAFPYSNWKGNIYAYSTIDSKDGVCLGSNQKKDEYSVVEIPEGYYYLSVCAQANVTPHFAVIKIDESLNSIPLDLLYQYWLDSAEEMSNKFYDMASEISSNFNLASIANGSPKIYLNVKNLNSSSSLTEQNIADDYFIYEYAGSENRWLTTDLFYPTGSNLIHIKGKAEFISKGNGCVILIANQKSINGKYKQLAQVKDDGEFDVTVDTSYLIAHEGYTDGFTIWWNNVKSQEAVKVKVSGFSVLEYTDRVDATSISGNTAKELFESVDENISDLESRITKGNDLISPSGNKYKIAITDEGSIVAIPYIPNKAAFFGNSLIIGLYSRGMAASRKEKDYYYLITEYIKTINPSFTAIPRAAGAKFEQLATSDENEVSSLIKNIFLDILKGDEDLVVLQLGDNVSAANMPAFSANCPVLIRSIKQKCPKARVVWMGMWYSSERKYAAVKNACEQTGSEYVFFGGLNTEDARNVIGATSYIESDRSFSLSNVTNVVENSPTNITFTFKVGSKSYSTTMDVTSYTPLSEDGILRYTGPYYVITDNGVASHPSDEGFRRITNRFLYQLGISPDEETYK